MLTLRRATSGDVATILRFVRELAAYERAPDAVVATEADLLRDGFGEAPRFEVMLADWDGAPIGFALYFFQYSTWTGCPVLYLEDLYVTPGARKRGAGRAFMHRLAAEAVARNCSRFQWSVLDWNAPSIAFYEALGAQVMRDWLLVRIDGEGLRALATANVTKNPLGD